MHFSGHVIMTESSIAIINSSGISYHNVQVFWASLNLFLSECETLDIDMRHAILLPRPLAMPHQALRRVSSSPTGTPRSCLFQQRGLARGGQRADAV